MPTLRAALDRLDRWLETVPVLRVSGVLVLLFLLLSAIPLWLRLDLSACSLDLAIYAQAMHRMARGEWNPFLSVRHVYAFGDHVDPVVLLGAPLTWVLPPAAAAILVEVSWVAAAPLPVLWLWRTGRIHGAAGVFAVGFLYFSPATNLATFNPVHPTTWAIFPMACLGAALVAGRVPLAVGLAVFLFTFREEFPFAGVTLAAALAWRRHGRAAAVLLVVSLAWAAVAFVVRPAMMPTEQYGGRILGRLLDPAAVLADYTRGTYQLRQMLRLAVPLAPLAVWMWRRRLVPDPVLVAPLLPLLAIRALRPAWDGHYMPVVIAGLLLAALSAMRNRARPPAWVFALTTACCLVTNGDVLEANARSYLTGTRRYPRDPGRLASLARAREYLLQHDDGPVLAMANLTPGLVARRDVYQVEGSHPPGWRIFRYVFVEKLPRGDAWPIGAERYADLVRAWRAEPGTEVIIDDEHVLLARGRFHRDR
ncbi:MAG: DUF2079 domain-containing protein [Deltaproteobacteria bacterium]|nr:DUF2079 domain-containing protein [Deltaproteobacteria bacterium]